MTMAPEQRAQASATCADTPCDECPALADGIDLIGEYEGSGFKEPPSLVRRGDGQVIQLPPLLYRLAAKADGRRTYEQIARELTEEIQRGVDADSVRFLVEEKLRPLGILCAADGSSPPLQKADPFLGLKLKAAVIPESVSVALGTMFKGLFLPLLVLLVLGAFVVTDWWLFGVHGVAQSIRQSIYNPVLFLLMFIGIVLSAGFHEVGHAAGCRYGGGRPGKMGCGLYLAWPAFYTDVTDAYRLGRRARLRTDLGGVYFNVIIVVATMAAYLVTRFEPLLLLIVIQHFEIAHQLLPVVRLDGYYIVSDITGVPDLFARIGPILRSLLPGKKADERVTVLKPWVRTAVTVWVLIVVPLLVFELFILLIHLPRILGTAWDSGSQGWDAAGRAFGSGNIIPGVGSVLQLLMLAVPIVGILLILFRSATGGGRWVWRHTDGRPFVRAVTFGTIGTLAAVLVYSWMSPDNYEPIRPGERGTVIQTARAIRDLPDIPRATARQPAPTNTGSTTTTTEPVVRTTVATQTTLRNASPTTAIAPSTTLGTTTTTRPTSTTVRPTTTTAP